MTCFEISVNGRTVCKAGIGDQQAVMTALICALQGSTEGSNVSAPRITLDVSGMADDLQMTWLEDFDRIQLGDTVTLQIVECAQADPPRTQKDTKTLHMKREEAQDPDEMRCCFCHRRQSEHRKLIAGPPVFICHQCVSVCVDILKSQP